MELMIRINGAPIAKSRHRTTRTGRTYWTQGKEQTAVQWEMIRQLPGGFIPLGGPLSVNITAAFKRPAKHFGTGRNAMTLNGSAPNHCMCRKDVDNISKFYLDAMNRIVYDDDRQVVDLSVRKLWSDGEGFVQIRIRTVPP